jgi:hypothetical protein
MDNLPLLRSGVLHPRQVAVRTANFIRPPTDGAATDMVRVCSPFTNQHVSS